MIKNLGSPTPNKIIILLLSPLFLSASLLDFRALDQAKEAYTEGNYSKAIEEYSRLKDKRDEVIYDEANGYYKLKEYKRAKELYASIKKNSLAFQKWHNLGNTHAQLGELDEGIKAYEEALKIKDDADTRFNLEFLKKKKKEQEKKDDKKKNDKKNNKKDDKEKKNDKKEQDNKEKSDKEKKKEEEQKKKEQSKEEKDKKKQEEQKKKEQDKEEQKKAQAQMKKEPISDKELRKYQKMLDQRGINTLMLPLKTKGEQNDEQKPW